MVWATARSFRLDDSSAKDVAQTVWLKLIENMHHIAHPERLPGWLATTCRREALRVVRVRSRTVVTEFAYDLEDHSPGVDTIIIENEERLGVVMAFQRLDEPCQRLLRLMTVEPALSYEEIAELVGRPVGSLGPTRARCLEKLKAVLARIKRDDQASSS